MKFSQRRASKMLDTCTVEMLFQLTISILAKEVK